MSASWPQNYFEIFGLPVTFQIDTKNLGERYHELQKMVHPDRFANASDRDRRLAVQHAANINEALSVLKSPLKRARYILILAGIQFDDEVETTQDPEFLMEQMELRESAAAVRDLDDPIVGITELIHVIEKNNNNMLKELEALIVAQQYPQAKIQVQKLQFLAKLLLECENIEQDLADAL